VRTGDREGGQRRVRQKAQTSGISPAALLRSRNYGPGAFGPASDRARADGAHAVWRGTGCPSHQSRQLITASASLDRRSPNYLL
jgi:hypothetical protein